MSLLLPIVALVLSIYTERKILPLANSVHMAIVVRISYVNWVLMALSGLHSALKNLHAAFVLFMLGFFLCLCQQIRIAQDMQEEQRIRAEELKRQQKLAADIAWEKEKAQRLALGRCPAGFVCADMGMSTGGCVNREKCVNLIIKPCSEL